MDPCEERNGADVVPTWRPNMIVSRRRLLAAGSSAVVSGVVGTPFIARAQQAEFTYKYANNLPVTHPMNTPGARDG